MELFGAKFSIALGSWKLRFVLMLEDADDVARERASCARPASASSQRTNGVACDGAMNLNFPPAIE